MWSAAKLNLELTKDDMTFITFGLADYHKKYEEQEILGEGCIGLVKALVDRTTGERWAVKQVTTTDEEIVSNV